MPIRDVIVIFGPAGLPVDDRHRSVLSYLTLMNTFTHIYFVSHFTRAAVRGGVSCGMYGEACG